MLGETTLNIQGIKINGEKINAYEVFFLHDYFMFSIIDNKGEQAEILSSRWEFRCCGNETDFIEKIIENESCFSFSLDDINSNPELLKRVNSDQDSSVYFESYIKASGLLKNGEELVFKNENQTEDIVIKNIKEIDNKKYTYFLNNNDKIKNEFIDSINKNGIKKYLNK